MEMNLKTLNAQAIASTGKTKKMGMSEDAQAIVFQMFTKNIYSNPIGTIVREITSNCFDSHIEAKVNEPVVIRKGFDKLANTHYISFIDFGVGMSPDRVENIYGIYFKSTKRTDNTQIGGFGIGGKTPLAYRRSTGFGEGEYDNSFNLITNYEGIKYGYVIYEGEDSPGIAELFQEPTTEHNGTEVRIPVLEKDINTFKREMVRQLYYFENVVFDGFVADENYKTDIEETLTNDYTIVMAKSFFFRGDDLLDNVHVCLGRVAYPLDYSVLGVDSSDYEFPVAIRLEIGEIGVTPSRESLNYSEATIKLLKSKLIAVKKEITEMLGKQYESIITLEDYFKVKNNFGELEFPNGQSFNVGSIIEQKDVDFSNFKYSFTKMPNDKQLFRLFFNSNVYGKKPRVSRHSWRNDDDNNDENSALTGSYDVLIDKSRNLLYSDTEIQRKIVKMAWLKEQHKTYYIITKKNIADIHLANVISDLFSVDDAIVDATGQPTVFVQSLIDMQDEYYEIVQRQCTDYNAVEVPQDFIDGRKANTKKLSEEFRKMTIPVKLFGGYRGTTRIKLDELFKLNVPIYYGLKEQDSELSAAEQIFGVLFNDDIIISHYDEYYHKFDQAGKKGIMFIRVAANNMKYMQYCQKAYPISTFKAKYIYRKTDQVTEYFQAQNFVSRFYNVPELYRCKGFMKLAPAWEKRISAIQKFIDKTAKKNSKSEWSNNKYIINRYFDLANLKNTKEQEAFIQTITDMEEMSELNKDTVSFLKVPYGLNDYTYEGFWNIAKQVLVF